MSKILRSIHRGNWLFIIMREYTYNEICHAYPAMKNRLRRFSRSLTKEKTEMARSSAATTKTRKSPANSRAKAPAPRKCLIPFKPSLRRHRNPAYLAVRLKRLQTNSRNNPKVCAVRLSTLSLVCNLSGDAAYCGRLGCGVPPQPSRSGIEKS